MQNNKVESKYIYISKLDAAKRQLEHAIKLFFHNGDVVVIHALTSAAHEVLVDLAKKQGIRSIVHGEAMDLIKPKYKPMLIAKFAEAKNYFKHADNDSETPLKFYPDTTQFDIWDACVLYFKLTKEIVPYFVLFNGWFLLKNQDILTTEAAKNQTLEIAKKYDPDNRAKFLEILPSIEKGSLG